MADEPVINLGENSAEYIAYRLLGNICIAEKRPINGSDRKWLLDTYAECLNAVKFSNLRVEAGR